MIEPNHPKNLSNSEPPAYEDLAARIEELEKQSEKLQQAEKRLRESENRYRTLFDSANDAILIMQDSRVIECNQKALEMFTCSREQIIGQAPYEFSPSHQPDGSQSSEKALTKIAEALNGKSDIFEWQHLRFNGEAFDAEVSLSLIEIESENFVQGILRDISVRKWMDKQLRLMHRWIEKSVDLFFWVGGDSRILYVNQAVRQLLGYTDKEFKTMMVGDFDLEITHEAWPGFTQILREKGSYYFETRLCNKNGEIIPAEITANILNFEGKDHFFAYGRDITARINTEKNNKELQDQLRQAQKMEAIGTLAGGIAHDFNNILGAIIGYSEIIKFNEFIKKSDLQDDVDQVLNAANRAKDLVQQILAFSRQVEHEIKPVLIVPVVKEALKLLRATLPTTIEMRQYIQTDNTKIFGDPSQIHQIIMNLCTNAGHAMQESGGILEVNLEEVTVDPRKSKLLADLRPGSYVQLTVSDTGHGIAPDAIEQIFNPYFTTKEKGEGTGLGLAVVHGIVKSHSGEITVDSQLDHGTKFQIYLPMIDRKVSADLSSKAEVPDGDGHILFVDDEKALARIGKQMLERLGYRVETRVCSTEALELFRANPHRFDLVVTDLTMPNITGIQLAREIVRLRPEIPIILCSGFSERLSMDEISEAGIRDLLMKPFCTSEIALSVKKALAANTEC